MSCLMQTRSFLGAMMGIVVYMNVEFEISPAVPQISLLLSLTAALY